MSQGDIEKRTGLLRCYVSRVENGHTIPSIETLEKWARALNVSLYQVFYEGNDSPAPQPLKAENSDLWGSEGKDAHYLSQLRRMLSRTRERDRQLLLHMPRKELLEFARSYLSEAFPKPQRIGCPSDWESISDHLTFCLPCFNRCMEILGELKRRLMRA